MTGLEHYGIDELYKLEEAANRAGDANLVNAVNRELDTRDIETYKAQQAEARFGA